MLLAKPTRVFVLECIFDLKFWLRPAFVLRVCHRFETIGAFRTVDAKKVRKQDNLFEWAFCTIVAERKLSCLTDTEVYELPPGYYRAISMAIEAREDHIKIISLECPTAAEVPHAADCNEADQLICAQDWQSAWWACVGSALLNGRYKVTHWTDVMHRLKEWNFGEVHPDCLNARLGAVEIGDPFFNFDKEVKAAALRLREGSFINTEVDGDAKHI